MNSSHKGSTKYDWWVLLLTWASCKANSWVAGDVGCSCDITLVCELKVSQSINQSINQSVNQTVSWYWLVYHHLMCLWLSFWQPSMYQVMINQLRWWLFGLIASMIPWPLNDGKFVCYNWQTACIIVRYSWHPICKVYPMNYVHSFILLCFALVLYIWLMIFSCDLSTHIL